MTYDTTTVNNYPIKTHITIASEPDYPPYCIVNEDGEADGFAVDLFKAAADAVGITYDIKIGIWDKIKRDLAEGRIDALPLVGRTPEREELFDFTIPYLSLHGAVFVHEDTEDINSLEDLKNKSIVVMKGDNAEEFVRRENISDKIFTTNTFEEAFQLLADGQYDAVITQRITGIKLLENLGIKMVKPLDLQLPEFRQDFCFAVKKGDQNLLNRLNEGLSIIIADDTYEKIRMKWFGPSIEEKLSLQDILIIAVYVFIPLFIIMAVISIILLRKEVKRRTKSLQYEIEEHKSTLKKLQEQQVFLKESESRIRLILNSTAEGIYGIDIKGNCTFINRSALEILGFKNEDQLIGKNMHDLIHYKKADGSLCPIDDCKIYKAFISGQGTHVNDEVFWKVDGTYFDAEYFSYPIRENGKIVGSVVTFWDITEKKQINEELKETKEYLENLITYANAPIIVWNKELKIERFNRAFERLTGLKFNDAVNRKIDVLFPEEKRNNYMQLIESTIEGERWETVEIEIQTIDGSIKNVLWNSANIYDEKKNLIATIAQGSDITDRKLAEKELLKMKEELEFEVQRRTVELNEKVDKLNKSQQAMLFMVEDLNEVTERVKGRKT
ncbi:MAG: transporter substrate-binding domain-containing protein [Melioribacteraceae bacterium]|nr:transporter substrate-binding domain-containing protein [Melioribacteraceae bacterium]